MVCPHCGAENPGYVLYCGSCGKPIREPDEPTNASGAEGMEVPEEPTPAPEVPARDDALRLPVSKLTMAVIAAAVAVVLVFIGLVLMVYYYESMLDPGRNFEDHERLFDIAMYSTYARMFGEVSALIGAVLVIQAFMVGGSAAAFAAMKGIRLRSLLWLGIVMAVCIGLATSVYVYVNEARPDLSETAMDVLARMMAYPLLIAVVLGAVALFIVTVALRNASIGGRTSTFASPPKTQ